MLWNTICMDAALDQLRPDGFDICYEDLVHLRPLGFDHINMPSHNTLLLPGRRRSLRTAATARYTDTLAMPPSGVGEMRLGFRMSHDFGGAPHDR